MLVKSEPDRLRDAIDDERIQEVQSSASKSSLDGCDTSHTSGNGFEVSRVSSEIRSQRSGRFLTEHRLVRPISVPRGRSSSAASVAAHPCTLSERSQTRRRGSMNSIIATAHIPAVFDVKVFQRFVPAVVERTLVLHPKDSHAHPKTEHFDGAVLFADASGFTALTERLSNQENGTELLCQTINAFFTEFITVADAHGGDVVKFSGVLSYFFTKHAQTIQ